MKISRVGNSNSYYLQQKASQPTDSFTAGDLNENIDDEDKGYDKVPDQFAGMSFNDLMNCGKDTKNQIPVVNQIVSSRNPEDRELYTTFFTDREITCNHADGRRAWKVEIKDTQQDAKVKEFFEKYEPDNERVKEYYSGDNMGMAAVNNFWLDLFNKG